MGGSGIGGEILPNLNEVGSGHIPDGILGNCVATLIECSSAIVSYDLTEDYGNYEVVWNEKLVDISYETFTFDLIVENAIKISSTAGGSGLPTELISSESTMENGGSTHPVPPFMKSGGGIHPPPPTKSGGQGGAGSLDVLVKTCGF